MTRITLPLLVACIGLGTWDIWERTQRMDLADRVSELESDTTTSLARSQMEQKKLTDQVASLKKKTKDQDAVLAEVAAAGPKSGPGSAAAKKDPSAAMAAGLAEMMKDPKARDLFKAQARMGIDMIYRDLFELLDLKEPQRSQFEKLVTEKATAGMDAGFSMMDGGKSLEEKKAIAAELKEKMTAMDQQIKDLVGKEDYSKMQRFEDSSMERMQLKSFDSMLKGKDLAMDEATETKLMDAMYTEREKFPFTSNFVDQRNPDITRFTPENLTRFGEEYVQLNESIATRAATILSPQQLELFRENQTQQTGMMKMHIEMGAKMFGSEDGH